MQSMNKTSKTAILAWALYDWAYSSYSVIVITFVFASYFTQSVAPNKILGTEYWGHAQALAGLLIALLSPLLGAIADHEGRRKPWILLFTIAMIIASSLLWFAYPQPSWMNWLLFWTVIGTVSLEVSTVFYNAMLNEIAPPAYLGRISGWAWGLGYAGGLSCLTLALFVFVLNGGVKTLGLDNQNAESIRICGPLVALWILAFSWPLFVITPDRPSTGLGLWQAMKKGLRSFTHTLLSIRSHREIFKFLLARMLYIDGLNTLFAFGSIYAAGIFHMNMTEVMEFGIAMNLGAGIGAAIFAWLDDHKGSRLTVLVTLCLMIACGSALLLIHQKIWFWIFALGVSLCAGPIQAASRSLLIRISPPELITELFGLYAFSGKVTGFIGPWVLATLTETFHSQRIGMSTVIFFLVLGTVLLSFVKTR